MQPNKASNRLQYLDWLRGLAAVIMLQGHVFHSFLKPDDRSGGPYILSQFLGGMPPAMFLFLTGVTLAFLMDGRERQGWPAGRRVMAALRRAGYLFGVAFLFRIQLWIFARPQSPWTDIFRVDILNCMGLAIAVISVMAVFRTAERVRLCAILGVAIAAGAPLISQLDWSGAHPFIKGYIAPDYNAFSFFPWASFLAFGVSAGSLIRLLDREQVERAMQWAALLGCGMIMGAQYFSSLPVSLYTKSEFWLDSPALVLIKLGAILLVLAFAFLWARHQPAGSWSWIRQYGVTSLLVYWVHIELVYGRWLGSWKESLNLTQTTVAAIALIVLMLVLSAARTNWTRLRGAVASLRWSPSPPPERVSGD